MYVQLYVHLHAHFFNSIYMSKVYSAIPSIILDKRRARPNGSYPVKLRITLNREQKYFLLGEDLFSDEWDKIQNTLIAEGRLKDERLKEIRTKLFGNNGYLQTAKRVIDKIPFFSFTEFEKQFFQKNQTPKGKNDVYAFFDFYIDKLNKQKRIGTATSYETAKNSLKAFKKTLKFDELNADLLEEYERKMLSLDKSPSTVGIYLRSLRTIINLAVNDGIITKENYPFSRNKYEIPAARNPKKALNLDEIAKIFNYETEPFSAKDKARDFWIFSYLCNGINIKDLCLLKWQNIDEKKITFIRAKTVRSKKSNQKVITPILTDPMREIIKKWGNKRQNNSDYIFPILEPNLTPQRERDLIQYFIKTTNKWMKRIAIDLGIQGNLTTYVARHSFSTILKRAGASHEFIGDSLGHEDPKTTERYLGSFEDNFKAEMAKLLTNF